MSEKAAPVTAGVEEPVPAKGITLEVSYATVPAFQHALELAQKHRSFRQFGEGKNLRIRLTYQLDELEALHEFKDATWELHHKRAFIHGNELAWAQMAQLTYCYRELLRRPRRDHCFFDGNFWNLWGCRYAVCNFADRINTEWLTFGRLEPDGTWVFDKARIAELVRKNLHQGFQFCPAYDEEFVDLALEVFPERIHPDEGTNWGYVPNRENQIIGVGPKDPGAARKMLYEFQEKIRQRRGPDQVTETGKRPLPGLEPRAAAAAPKKGLLARLFR